MTDATSDAIGSVRHRVRTAHQYDLFNFTNDLNGESNA